MWSDTCKNNTNLIFSLLLLPIWEFTCVSFKWLLRSQVSTTFQRCLSWNQGLSWKIWPQPCTWAMFDFQAFRLLLRPCMKVYRSLFHAVTNTFDMIWFFRYERMNLCLKRDLYVGSTARFFYCGNTLIQYILWTYR